MIKDDNPQEEPMDLSNPAGRVVETERKLAEPSRQVAGTGEQTDTPGRVMREEDQADLSALGALECLAAVASTHTKLLVKQAEPEGQEIMMEIESAEPEGEFNYDHLILRPAFDSFRSLSCGGFLEGTIRIADVLCESYIPFKLSCTLLRDNTCPR